MRMPLFVGNRLPSSGGHPTRCSNGSKSNQRQDRHSAIAKASHQSVHSEFELAPSKRTHWMEGLAICFIASSHQIRSAYVLCNYTRRPPNSIDTTGFCCFIPILLSWLSSRIHLDPSTVNKGSSRSSTIKLLQQHCRYSLYWDRTTYVRVTCQEFKNKHI